LAQQEQHKASERAADERRARGRSRFRSKRSRGDAMGSRGGGFGRPVVGASGPFSSGVGGPGTSLSWLVKRPSLYTCVCVKYANMRINRWSSWRRLVWWCWRRWWRRWWQLRRNRQVRRKGQLRIRLCHRRRVPRNTN
jgi:hypothetical protein